MLNESRRQLLTNVAKAVPLTAVAIATGSSRTMAAPKGGSGTTALVKGTAATAPGAAAGIFQGTLT
jgi:hypothetical protein